METIGSGITSRSQEKKQIKTHEQRLKEKGIKLQSKTFLKNGCCALVTRSSPGQGRQWGPFGDEQQSWRRQTVGPVAKVQLRGLPPTSPCLQFTSSFAARSSFC